MDIGGSAECSKEREMLQEEGGRRGEGREEREGEVLRRSDGQ